MGVGEVGNLPTNIIKTDESFLSHESLKGSEQVIDGARSGEFGERARVPA